jgi:hypothetical protein
MTPSINRLANSAKALGEYVMESEFSLVEDEFCASSVSSYEQFARWVTGYRYYDAMVCACGGTLGDVLTQLQADYEELVELRGDNAEAGEEAKEKRLARG